MRNRLASALAVLAAAIPSVAQADGFFADGAATAWTGVYVGAGIGKKWADTDWTTTCFGDACTTGGVNPFLVDTSSPEPSIPTASTRRSTRDSTGTRALGVGCRGRHRLRQQGEPGIPGCTTFCGSLPPTPDDIDSAAIETLRDGSIRGRAGFLVVPSLLLYGTAGVAFQRIEANVTCSFAGPWCFPPAATDIRNETQTDKLRGWTVGGGLEWLVHDHWLVRGEYRYADLGDFSPTFFSGTPDAIFTNIHVATQTATFGIGYKF